MNSRITFDIDMDFADRDKAVSCIDVVPAAMCKESVWSKHATGVYATKIPVDSLTGLASIDYKQAEDLGYMKLDLLNVSVYEQVRDEDHLKVLMDTPPLWDMLTYQEFVEQVIHINGQFRILKKMPEPIDSIEKMAMFISLIRPAKRHLIGKPWNEVATDVWVKPLDGSYHYKRSHSLAYAQLVAVHMNLLCGI